MKSTKVIQNVFPFSCCMNSEWWCSINQTTIHRSGTSIRPDPASWRPAWAVPWCHTKCLGCRLSLGTLLPLVSTQILLIKYFVCNFWYISILENSIQGGGHSIFQAFSFHSHFHVSTVQWGSKVVSGFCLKIKCSSWIISLRPHEAQNVCRHVCNVFLSHQTPIFCWYIAYVWECLLVVLHISTTTRASVGY